LSKNYLNQLLIEARKFGCEYENGLSNHLPMALIALDRIGADQMKLTEFYSEYCQILEIPDQDNIRITHETWSRYLGQFKYNLAYREFFLKELSEKGIPKALEFYLPHLIPGVSGGAFHPLIRLAYALEVDSSWEVAESLTAWCMAYQELAELSEKVPSSVPPQAQFDLLSEYVRESPVLIEGDTVFGYFKSASNSKAFKDFEFSGIAKTSLPEVADIAIKLYLSTNDSFTALHCVTATHAIRVVSKFYKDPIAVRYLWQAICAAYVAIKCVPIQGIKSPDVLPSWEKIFSRVRGHKNDHVIKFVYSTFCESQIYRNPLYQYAAAKKAGIAI
jgi:hypothetical protein